MKSNPLSFLFFSGILFLVSALLPVQSVRAQAATDSTTYFYHKLVSPTTSDDLGDAYGYFLKYKEDRSVQNDTLGMVYALRLLAIAEYEMGRTYTSENSAIEALKLVNNASPRLNFDPSTQIGIQNHLGMVYDLIDQPKKAIEAYSQALQMATRSSDSVTLLNNMANSYKKLENYDEAIAILTSVYERSKQENDLMATARALDNLGHIQAKAGDPAGLKNMLDALELRRTLQDHGQLFASYRHLSEYYTEIGDRETAKRYATLGKQAAARVSVSYKKEALAQYLALSDNEDVVEFVRMTDSLSEASLRQDNKFASVAYNVEKERQRTQAAQLESEKERRLKSIYQVIGVSLVLLATGTFLLLQYRHRQEKIAQLYRTEAHFSKKVHDEVANDLYQIMAKIQTAPGTTDALLDDLDVVYHKTRDISKEHGLIDTDTDFGELLKELLLPYQSADVNLITKNLFQLDWSDLSKEKKITLYRVLQELMTNMRKHSKASLVVISAKKKGAHYHIEYVDNGEGGVVKKGNGLQNAENRISTVKGSIIFDSTANKGFTANIRL